MTRVSDGKRVRLTFSHFSVGRIEYVLVVILWCFPFIKTQRYYDDLKITWTICNYGFFSYDIRLTGYVGYGISSLPVKTIFCINPSLIFVFSLSMSHQSELMLSISIFTQVAAHITRKNFLKLFFSLLKYVSVVGGLHGRHSKTKETNLSCNAM